MNRIKKEDVIGVALLVFITVFNILGIKKVITGFQNIILDLLVFVPYSIYLIIRKFRKRIKNK